MADFVGEDVVDEILVRLPVKSMVRLESVCKGWQSRSRSPSFAEFYKQQKEKKSSKSKDVHVLSLKDLYTMASPLWNREPPITKTLTKTLLKLFRNVHGPLYAPVRRPPYRDVDWKSKETLKRRKITAIGLSSNGVYCLTSVSKEFHTGCEEAKSVRIALCNLSIRHFKFLPPFPAKFHPQLAEISSKGDCRVSSGFGSDYSVVVLVNYKFKSTRLNRFLFFLYTSKRGWEIIEGPSSKIMEIYRAPVCTQNFLHGCWHWMAQGVSSYEVLSFNFARQSFDVISVPSVLEYGGLRVAVIVLRGHLALISWREADNWSLQFDVCVMMDYGVEESWTNIFSIHTHYYEYFDSFLLYGIDYVKDQSERGGIRIKKLYFTSKDRTLVIFCDRNGSLRASNIQCHSSELDVSFSTLGMSVYTESLERP